MTTTESLWRSAHRRDAPPEHGTRARYNWKADPCRCPGCTAANTTYIAAWRSANGRDVSRTDGRTRWLEPTLPGLGSGEG